MVESNTSTGPMIIKNQGAFSALSQFLEPKEMIGMQQLCKRSYELIPQIMAQVEVPQATVLLERKRTEFYLSRVNPTQKSQKYWKLMEIGKEDKPEERIYSKETLGFEECYFQFFVMISEFEYYAWPLHDESFLRDGYHLTFDRSYKLKKSEKIPDFPEQMMRPTIMQVRRSTGGVDLLFLAGDKERNSLYFDTVAKVWYWLPRLPTGHNITCNVALNWKDRAIFTFVVDGAMNIKCAVLELANMKKAVDKSAQDQEMYWVLKLMRQEATMELSKEAQLKGEGKHAIDRFHVKSALMLNDNSIGVVARGRIPNMREAISWMLLRFDVHEIDGKFALVMREKVHRAYPTIFPRQLDYTQRHGQRIVCVQDTADADPFEVMSIDLAAYRRDNANHMHVTCKIDTLI